MRTESATSEILITKNAYDFAAAKHAQQKRRDGTPYIRHLISVAHLSTTIYHQLQNNWPTSWVINPNDMNNEHVIYAAGMLHDVIEDTQCDFDDVVKQTNEEVAKIVSLLSDDKRLSSHKRHQAYAHRLVAGIGTEERDIRDYHLAAAHIIKLADIIDNTLDTVDLIKPDSKELPFLTTWIDRSIEMLNVLTYTKHLGHYAFCLDLLHSAAEAVKSQFCLDLLHSAAEAVKSQKPWLDDF